MIISLFGVTSWFDTVNNIVTRRVNFRDNNLHEHGLQYLQIRTDAATDRQIHTLETELARLRMMHDDGKTKLKQLERHLRNYEMVSIIGYVVRT